MKNKGRLHSNAFTIAEVLIALAITAILMAAVAVAFNASVINYNENKDIFNAINKARQALSRITTELRTAKAVVVSEASSQCSLIVADGSDFTYQYNSSDNKLYLVTNDDLSDSDYLLCDNVTAMSFTKQTAVEDSVTYVKSVLISITVSCGNTHQSLSAAAVIRKNLQ